MPKFNCSMGAPLDMLGEEGCEVGQAVFKLRRFGNSNETNPAYTGPSPMDEIHTEAGDFIAAVAVCVEEGFLDASKLQIAINAKMLKLKEEFGYLLPSQKEET